MSGDRIDWGLVLIRAATIVRSYPDTSVTLRLLFYRLVSEQVIPNEQSAYKGLSGDGSRASRRELPAPDRPWPVH